MFSINVIFKTFYGKWSFIKDINLIKSVLLRQELKDCHRPRLKSQHKQITPQTQYKDNNTTGPIYFTGLI